MLPDRDVLPDQVSEPEEELQDQDERDQVSEPEEELQVPVSERGPDEPGRVSEPEEELPVPVSEPEEELPDRVEVLAPDELKPASVQEEEPRAQVSNLDNLHDHCLDNDLVSCPDAHEYCLDAYSHPHEHSRNYNHSSYWEHNGNCHCGAFRGDFLELHGYLLGGYSEKEFPPPEQHDSSQKGKHPTTLIL